MSHCVCISKCMKEKMRNTCLLATKCVYIFLTFLNHSVFVDYVHPCEYSFFVCLCLEGPILSHLESSLCLPPVYSVHKNSCLSLHHSKSRMLFCRLCRQRTTIPLNLEPGEEGEKNIWHNMGLQHLHIIPWEQ